MRKLFIVCLALLAAVGAGAKKKKAAAELWPDGTPIDAWFSDTLQIDPATLGKQYVLTDYGVRPDSTIVQTEAIQKVIDRAAKDGGGVVVVPQGTFLSGSLFFRQGTHLQVLGKLKGSDRIRDFRLLPKTRLEGQTLKYFAALVNADGINGFTITGPGYIDGNGYNYWEEFWLRRQYNKECTNLEAMRPRLVWISNCKNVTLQGVHLQNSPFWTTHLYRSERVRYLGCTIYSPTQGMKAPSSDAIDIDVCRDILVHRCYMSVNDDAVVMKGGKGTWADTISDNGPNSNIIVQYCNYGKVHACMTLGSESIHNRNIILRHCKVEGVNRLLWLKMRPDTPQHYEYVAVEDVAGTCASCLVVRPWTQFFKPGDRKDMPLSECNNIALKGLKLTSKNFFDVGRSDKYRLRDFSFTDCDITDTKQAFDPAMIEGSKVSNTVINGKKF